MYITSAINFGVLAAHSEYPEPNTQNTKPQDSANFVNPCSKLNLYRILAVLIVVNPCSKLNLYVCRFILYRGLLKLAPPPGTLVGDKNTTFGPVQDAINLFWYTYIYGIYAVVHFSIYCWEVQPE